MKAPDAETGPRTLREAAGLVLVGAADRAREFLASWTGEHPDDIDGWFLSTLAVTDPALQLTAATELRRLAPAPVAVELLQRRIVAGWAGDDLERVALDVRWWTQLDPESPRAWRMLALVHLVLGRDDRASDAARHLLDRTPRDPAAQQLVLESRTGLVPPPLRGPAPDAEQVDTCWHRAQHAANDHDQETALRELIALAPHVGDGYADLSLLLARADDLVGALDVAEAGARQARRPAAPDGWLPPRRSVAPERSIRAIRRCVGWSGRSAGTTGSTHWRASTRPGATTWARLSGWRSGWCCACSACSSSRCWTSRRPSRSRSW